MQFLRCSLAGLLEGGDKTRVALWGTAHDEMSHQHRQPPSTPPESMTDGADISFYLDGGDAIDALGEEAHSALKNSQAII